MKLREAIECLAQGVCEGGSRDALFDQALEIALLAAAAHEAHCALAKTSVGDYQLRNFRERYANETFQHLCAAERADRCAVVLS